MEVLKKVLSWLFPGVKYQKVSDGEENFWKFISAEIFQTSKGYKRIERYKNPATRQKRVHVIYTSEESSEKIHLWDCCRFRGSNENHECKFKWSKDEIWPSCEELQSSYQRMNWEYGDYPRPHWVVWKGSVWKFCSLVGSNQVKVFSPTTEIRTPTMKKCLFYSDRKTS